MKSLLFVVVDPATFLQFRVPIAVLARESGYDVHVATKPSPDGEAIEQLGFKHHEIPLTRSGINPMTELRAFWSIVTLLGRIKPDVAHFVTIKPVLYGAIAARIARTKGVVVAVSGLGRTFIAKGFLARIRLAIVSMLYRVAFDSKRLAAIFQNEEDLAVIQSMTKLDAGRFFLIDGGSGVDLDAYTVTPQPDGRGVVLFAGRLLRDKGIIDFIEAARKLRKQGATYRFLAAGATDPGNPATLSEADVAEYGKDGPVEFLGFRADLPDLIARANVVTLPSYREGFPKVLIEAAASGRAVVTTDVPGCRQAVVPEQTGILVPRNDPEQLAIAIERLMSDGVLRDEMGRKGRSMAEARFDVRAIAKRHLEIYEMLGG